MSAALDENYENPAYHYGRLFCLLEDAQRAAIPGLNATIADRFFGTASAAPQSVFPRLLKGAQHHLAKLRRDNEGAYHALQQRIEQVMERLPPRYPTFLVLEEQGMFMVGYYHQRAKNRAEMRERHARNQSQPTEE